MENGIKVGEFVRTDNGIIGKYVKYRGIEDSIENNNKWIGFDIEKDIVKHSFNLIDIIEVKDIIQIKRGLYDDYNFIFICSDEDIITAEETIKKYAYRILTHEQFESISYKVERKD